MKGQKKGAKYAYVDQLGYDKFEQRVFLAYGNGTKTTYSYEADRRRLENMTAKTAAGRIMMDNVYGYDAVNNILSLKNNAPVPEGNLMGGSSEYSYEYDDLYRLEKATGKHLNSSHENTYTLDMKYNSVGGIEHKSQVHQRKGVDETDWAQQHKTTYDMSYTYGNEQPHAPKHIGDKAYSYDANGNMTGVTHDVSGQKRQIIWDEENRIRAIHDNGAVHHYTYDASGERVLKGKSNGQAAYVNGEWTGGSGSMGNYTVYVNPYLVLKSGSYTKHFYIEGQRIVSKLGDGMGDATKGNKAGKGDVNYGAKQEESREGIVRNLKWLGEDGALLTAGNSGKTPPGQIIDDGTGSGGNKDGEKFQYFYHPDHLGSTSYITDASGEVYQHLEYFAFGETFVEEHSNTQRTPYKFNGKELDEETGLYYYGARYYDPQISIFASFDPLAELYPNVSPYAYVFNNPINYIDPTGMTGEGVTDPPTEEELEATKEGGWVKSNDGHTQKLAAVTVKASRIEDNNSDGGNGIGKAGNNAQNGGSNSSSPWFWISNTATLAGAIAGEAEGRYVRSDGSWRGKDGRYWPANQRPNGTTGSKKKVVSTAGKWQLVSRVAFFIGASISTGQFIANPTFDQGIQSGTDIGFGALGLFSGPGAFFSGLYFGDQFLQGVFPSYQNLRSELSEAHKAIGTGPSYVGSDGRYVCFTAGTLIHTENGLKPIEEIDKGDLVYSYDFKSKSTKLQPVNQTFIRETEEIYYIYIGTDKITVTSEHPFYIKNKGWVKVRDLVVGDQLHSEVRDQIIISEISKNSKKITVYNIEVATNHNYFITEMKILVHNKSIESEMDYDN